MTNGGFKPYYLGPPYYATALGSDGYFVHGSDGKGISAIDMGLAPEVTEIEIIGASIRILGWTASSGGQVQSSVQIDTGMRYANTSTTLAFNDVFRIAHAGQGAGAIEGDSSAWIGLVGLDLQAGRAGDTYKIAHFDPILFDCVKDRIYMEIGGTGAVGLFPVFGLIWKGPKPVNPPWKAPIQNIPPPPPPPPPPPAGTTGTWGNDSNGSGGRSLRTAVNALYGGFRFQAPAAGTLSSVKINVIHVYAAGNWVAQVYADNGSQPGTLLGASAPLNISNAGEKAFTLTGPAISNGGLYWIVISPVSGTPGMDVDACNNDANYLSGRGNAPTTLTALPNNDDWRMQIGWT